MIDKSYSLSDWLSQNNLMLGHLYNNSALINLINSRTGDVYVSVRRSDLPMDDEELLMLDALEFIAWEAIKSADYSYRLGEILGNQNAVFELMDIARDLYESDIRMVNL